MKIKAEDIEPRKKPSNYPGPFASRMNGRIKRQLGDHFGLTKFGVNLTVLEPGAQSALLHKHTKQEEFIYILSGHPTLHTSEGSVTLNPGDCCGFTPNGSAHHLINNSQDSVTYLEVGDREPGDEGQYPEDDLKAVMDANGKWVFTRKDGTPY